MSRSENVARTKAFNDVPKIMLLFAIENGMKIDSDMPAFSSGLMSGAALGVAFDDALGVHSNRFDMIRL